MDNPVDQKFNPQKEPACKTFIRNGQPDDKREKIENMISQGSTLIEDAKQRYFTKIG